MATFFVCYQIGKHKRDRTVVVKDDIQPLKLVDALRQQVHPDISCDRSREIQGQSSRDCTILNFIRLD